MKHLAIIPGLTALTLLLAIPMAAQDAEQQAIDLSGLDEDVLVFTEPVRADGSIDYIAALNAHYGEGVTAEDNAYAGLIVLYDLRDDEGKWHHGEDWIERTAMGLGIEVADLERGPYLVSWIDHAIDEHGFSVDQAQGQLDELVEGTIGEDGLTQIADWADAAEPVLQSAGQALQRPRYFAPLIQEDDGMLYSVLLPHLSYSRRLCRSLHTYACYHATQGGHEQVVWAVQTMRLLALRSSQDATFIGGLVAISLDAMTRETVRQLLQMRVLPAEAWAQIEQELRDRPPLRPLGEAIAMCEKAMVLDMTMCFLTGEIGVEVAEQWFDVPAAVYRALAVGEIDAATVIEGIDAYYDQVLPLYEAEGYAQYHHLADELSKEQQANGERLQELMYVRPGVINPRLRSSAEHRAQTLIAIAIEATAALEAGPLTERRLAASHLALLAAVACERYRHEHGKAPEELVDLVPDFLDAVPTDPFNGQPLSYSVQLDGYTVYSVGADLQDNGGVDGPDQAVQVQWHGR